MAIQQGSSAALTLYPKGPGETIYWLTGTLMRNPKALVSMSTIFMVDYDLMHRRLGHPSEDVLRQAKRHCDKFPEGLIYPKDRPICRGCAEAKSHLPMFEDSVSRASSKFELIHSDLKELPVISYHKYKWFITFLDDYSSHCWVVFLRKKSDAYNAIIDFLAMVRTQHNITVKTFMTDAGGEYKSDALMAKFKELGIRTHTSVPHMHQQNGRAERLNRTLMEKAQALRFDACLPQNWWEFTVEHAVHLYNRTPVRRLAWRTPFGALNLHKPDISHLRVFGCGAYVFIPEDVRQNKLTPRAEMMIFIGYTSGIKGFKFMRKPNNIIFHAVTALFDEFTFPYCPDNKSRGHTCIGREYPSEDNIPPEDGGWFDGGAYPPNMPNIPAGNVPPVVPQGPVVPPQPPVMPPAVQQGQQGAQQPPNQPPWHARWPAAQRQLWLERWWEDRKSVV